MPCVYSYNDLLFELLKCTVAKHTYSSGSPEKAWKKIWKLRDTLTQKEDLMYLLSLQAHHLRYGGTTDVHIQQSNLKYERERERERE